MSLPTPTPSPSAPLAPAAARPPPPSLWIYLAATLAYFAVTRLGLWSAHLADKFTPVWLGNGLAIWLTIRFGPRILIALAIGSSAANGLHNFPAAGTLAPLVLATIISGNILSAYLGARLWQRGQDRCRARFGDFCEPLCCALAALASPVVSASVGVGALVALGGVAPATAPTHWLAWWTAEAIGTLFLLPLLLATPALGPQLRHATARDFTRAAVLLGLSASAVAVIYGLPSTGRYLFALLPLLILATAWFKAPGTRLLAFLLAAAGTVAAALGRGPFATGQLWDDLLSAQLFLAASGLIALFLPPIQARRNLLRPLPLALMLGGWALSGLLVGHLIEEHQRKAAADFAQRVASAETAIENRIAGYVAALRSARGFVLGSPTVTRGSWQTFVRSLERPTHYPGLRGVGLVYPVPPEELENFIARARADGTPDFTLRAMGDATLSRAQPHFVLTHLELVGPSDQTLLGQDFGSQPLRRKTLEAARDTGQPQIVPRAERTQQGPNFSLYLPVFAVGAPVTTVAERRAALRAWVHAGFSVELLLQSVLGVRGDKLHFYLFESGPLDPAHLLYSSRPPGAALPAFALTHVRRMFGQDFTFAWNRGPAFVTESRTPLILLAVSLALGTVLLTGWVLSLQGFREQAEALVQERTAALRASESRSRLLVRSANVGLWDWDLATGSLYYSPEWKGQLGYADHELPSRYEEWESRLHPEDRAATLAAVAEFQAGTRLTYDVEFRLRHRDRSWRWILTQAELTRDASGRVVRMTGSHIDITARKAADTALRATEQRFADLVNSTDGIVWEADATTFAFVSVSQNAERLLGYPVAEWLQPGFWAAHIHPDDREHAVQFWAACSVRAEDHDFEYRFTAADGRLVWLRDIVRIVSENGQTRWLRGLMIDITAQKTATEALRQSQSMLHALTESTSDAIFVKDLQGRYLMFNSAASRFVGKTAADVLGRDDSALFPPDQARHVMAGDRQIIASGRTQTYEQPELSTADGLTAFQSTQGPIRNALGEIVGLFGISRDVTSRKQAEQALARTTEMLERTGELGKIGGWSLDLPTMKLTWTRETFRIAGIEPPIEPPLADGINVFAPAARPTIAAAVQAAIDHGMPYDLELPIITAQGEDRWVHTQGFAEMREGRTIRVYGTFQDITTQKHAELTLRASEERFRILVEHSPYCIHEIDLAGGLTSMNWAGRKMLGVDDVSAIQGLPYLDGVGPRDRERIAGLMAGALAGRTAEFTFQGSTGKEYQSSFVPIMNDQGLVQRVMGMSIDITAQTHATTALRTSEARLRALVAAIPDLIFEQGRNGDFRAVHAVDSQLLLAPSESLVGHNITEFLPAPIATRALGGFGAALDTGEIQVLNYALILRGTEKHFEARIARCTVESVLVIVRDITERKQAEVALQSSLAEKTALLKEVHHRVKNNLQVITSLLRLESGRSAVPATKAVLTEMQSRIRAMALLHESLYRTGTFAAVDLGAYIGNIATDSFRMLNPAPSLVRLTLALAPLHVTMDQATPCGLLVNELISNCLKHGFPAGRGGEVRIELQPVAGSAQVCLRVSDDGIGLPPDFATRRGQSLGLQLVDDLIEQLNGTLLIGPAPAAIFAVTFTPAAAKIPPLP